MTNLKVAAIYDDSPAGQRFAVREDWPEMVDIPNKTLETITDSDASTIHNRWINVRFERQFDWMLVFGDYARGILADRQ